MTCKQVREEFFDLASGGNASPAIDEHVRHCAACAAELAGLKATMSLMDEWKAPEPSPYFDARLRVRLHEAAPRSWREWLADAMSPFTATGRKLALGAAMVLLAGVGVALFQGSHPKIASVSSPQRVEVAAKPGSAVSDLQALDKNEDLFANFDLLDDVNP